MPLWLIPVIVVFGLAALVFGFTGNLVFGLAALVISLTAYVLVYLLWPSRRVDRPSAVESREAAARVRPRVSIAVPARGRPRVGRVAPAEREAPAPVSPDIGGVALTEREAPAPVSPDIGGVALTEREAPAAAMAAPEVAEKVVIPREKEVYKEARMGENYIARDDNEAKIIRALHPDCEVVVESEYEKAIDTITGCPLSCPYRAVAFTLTELDQDRLRKRTK